MEQYTDAEALEVHRKSDYFLAANGVLGGLVAGAPEIELFESLARLTRVDFGLFGRARSSVARRVA